MEMTNQRKNQLDLLCWQHCAITFSLLCNEEMRGPKFSWDNFDGDVVAETIMHAVQLTEDEAIYVHEQCMDISYRLKEKAGVVEEAIKGLDNH